MKKITQNFLKKYRYLIFILVYIIVSALLAFLFVGAISQNIGAAYWQVFLEAYFLTFLAVLLGSAAVLFAVSVISLTGIFKGKGGFLAFVIAYAMLVVILGPLIYIGLLNV